MSETTAIGWTEKTWNPWQGCHKVSPGCKHCYMFAAKRRYGQEPNVVKRSAAPTFYAPLKWKEPALVFTCSWSDWFIEEADPWRAGAWDVIRRTPHLTYQILTKRPERIAAHLPQDWGAGYRNVWLGASVEDQANADRRIPLLLAVPAAVRFLSVEPLLGPVDLARWFRCEDCREQGQPTDRTPAVSPCFHRCGRGELCPLLHWCIVGGESGPGFRPMTVEWLVDAVRQCQAAVVPCFVKQDAHRLPGQQGRIPDEVWRVKEFPGTAPGEE